MKITSAAVPPAVSPRSRPAEQPAPEPLDVLTRGERVREAVGQGLLGGVGGALAGAGVGAGLTFMEVGSQIFNVALGGRETAMTAGLMLVPMVAGAGLGFAGGVYRGAQQVSPDPLDPPRPLPVLANRIRGGLIGAAAPALTLVPLFGLGFGTYAGMAVGRALDRRTSLGLGVGACGGTGYTIAGLLAMQQLMNQGNWVPAAALAVAGAAVGALTGPAVFAQGSPFKRLPEFTELMSQKD